MVQSRTLRYLATLSLTVFTPDTASADARFSDDSTSAVQNEIIFDLSLFPASEAGGEYGWSPTIAIRAGLSRNVVRTINVEGYLEYYQLRLPNQEGNTSFSPSGAKRQDFAAYAGLSFSRFLLIGAGTYYTTSPGVKWFDPLIPGGPQPWEYSGFSEFRFFWTVGANYDIHITNEFFLPIGLYYRNSYRSNGGITFFRIGTALRF